MPFKLFHGNKSKKQKSGSVNGSDLSDRKCEEPPDSDHRSSHKNIFHIFSTHKNSSTHVHFKNSDSGKEKKVKAHHPLGAKSMSHLPSSVKSVHAPDTNGNNELHIATGQLGQARRVASYSTFIDISRERRLTEIVQLDNYMNYLRHTEDEGNMASRLCCAQVLKMSLIMLEQRHRNSQEKLDLCHKGSPSSSRYFSSGSSRTSLRKRNMKALCTNYISNNSSEDHNGNISSTSGSNSDSDTREHEHDSGSEPDSESPCRVQNNLTEHKLSSKTRSTPVWPRDIEIF